MSELRAAAERLIKYGEVFDNISGWGADLTTVDRGAIQAGVQLAKAFIAEHPADNEPVTEEFLDQLFGTDTDAMCSEWHDEWGEAITWLDEYGHVKIPMPKTRGDVRRLCQALGVKIRESHDANEAE